MLLPSLLNISPSSSVPGMFSESALSPASRRSVPSRDPSSSKRVCFYKSGDPQFSGHRVVINSRTFKTFDALLDALSKKVPLPFGVRTITTPKGTHTVRSLDDLRDGASYVCSDQKKVKPLNLEEVNRRQVPWNTTRPTSAGRHGRRGLIRQLMKKNEVRRAAKAVDRFVAVWSPKKLVVYKNRDPSTKRTIVLQRRTAPTFEALLDYLSQVLQFTVVKLYTEDGRRVDGLPALIMCSGIVVAAGNEPFWMGNYNLQGSSQLTQSDVSESIEPANTQVLPSKP
uniref:RP1 axonemal microtubule associated n=1 Tax=Astyanax mexicanus TaxID=7994 RepID=A0A8B9LKI3_ASTMX